MSDYRFRIIQDGQQVVSVVADDEQRALAEIDHYAVLYSQEGTIRIERRRGKGSWREYLP